MAITPLELQTLSTEQISSISRARSIIDAELRLKVDEAFPIKIRQGIIDFIFKENAMVLDALISEYRAAGWEVVTYLSDSQGTWLSFYPSST
jgi:hypothetical protein